MVARLETTALHGPGNTPWARRAGRTTGGEAWPGYCPATNHVRW
ncbi:MAG: hypothetical protein RLZZ326_4240 [Planctomycetota bacterium]|jgi:hypothetical protein